MNHHESEPRRIGIVPRVVLGTTLAVSSAVAVDTATRHNVANAKENTQEHSQQINNGSGGYSNKDGKDFPLWTLAALGLGNAVLVVGGLIIRKSDRHDDSPLPTTFPKNKPRKKKSR